MQDPISDMLTRIRNAGLRRHADVMIPASRHKGDILRVLQEQGFIETFASDQRDGKPFYRVALKYFNEKSVISSIKRVSSPSLRRYSGSSELPKVLGGLGCLIVTTSQGVMTDQQARKLGVGGELICTVE